MGEDDGARLVGAGSRHSASLSEVPRRRVTAVGARRGGHSHAHGGGRGCAPRPGRLANDEYHVRVLTSIDIDRLIADTETAILRHHPRRPRTSARPSCTPWCATTWASTATRREASASGRSSACWPTSRSPATMPARCRVPPPSRWATTSASSTMTSRTTVRSAAIGPRCGPCRACPRPSTPATRSSRSAAWPSTGSPTEGFDDARVLRLMRLYDETCLALCEGQFMDIWSSEHDEWMSVD